MSLWLLRYHLVAEKVVDPEKFLKTAQSYLGTPFHHQGRGRHGLDCLGLVTSSLARQGVKVKNEPTGYGQQPFGDLLVRSIEQSGLVARIDFEERRPGDLLVFRIRTEPQHMGIVIEPFTFIHAIEGGGVQRATLSEAWLNRIVGVFTWVR